MNLFVFGLILYLGYGNSEDVHKKQVGGYKPNRDKKKVKIQTGYDSSLTESMPIPSSELSSDVSS